MAVAEDTTTEASESVDRGRGLLQVQRVPLSLDPTSNMRTTLKDFFDTSKFSDLVIRTEDQEFKVHKIVVCGQSEYFACLLSGKWKEATGNAVDLKEDDARAVEAMIHFMYGFDYDSSGSSLGRISPMLFNAMVYKVADKYGVPALKHLAQQKFDSAVTACWNMDDFPHVIAEVYTTTVESDKGLRDRVVSVSYNNIQSLFLKEDFIRVLNDTPSFAADVLQLLVEKPSTKRYTCPSCSKQWEANLSNDVTYYCLHCGSRRSDWKNYLEKKD
ncbi:hypothetical protein Egran_00364 [Elaphomyces granulatus]|uniref:BTB domain-containing protein n=1 Tax=Elaphomyces granulatus TaxID=519963 RepID=A0A232M6F5_9EURO|nr:hypothetical protein Egran_00364 [Elaphomyces granulatus]